MFESIEDIIRSKKLSTFTGTPQGHLGSGWVRKLEDAFCEYYGTKYAVAMNSATACLHASMVATVKRGDFVAVTPYSFSSSASCCLMVGANPVFIDIDDTFNLSPDALGHTRKGLIKAVIPVHLFGNPCDMDKVMDIAHKNNLAVIEDCAQAIGSVYKGKKVGTIGDCGIFSFNQAKQISTGEGGMLITNDDYIARVARAVRNHGEVADPELGIVGFNYRMCEIEACLALQQFKKLSVIMNLRGERANELTNKLKGTEGITLPTVEEGCVNSWYRYPVRYSGELEGFTRGYVSPLYKLPIYKMFGYNKLYLPNVEIINKEILLNDLK
jgi:dTDP-4-amino-4,6-dideoxygalactose transaminase